MAIFRQRILFFNKLSLIFASYSTGSFIINWKMRDVARQNHCALGTETGLGFSRRMLDRLANFYFIKYIDSKVKGKATHLY